MSFETTKDQADRSVVEVDMMCATAATCVRSMMPSLGKYWEREADELDRLLTEIPKRFERAIRKAQKKGWAAK